MRKILFFAAAIIILLLLCFTGWLQYRQYTSYKIPVHANAQTIVRVNADKLIRIFISEYGFNFRKKISAKDVTKKDTALNTGIYLPGNIFIYNISSKLPSTFFCTLPIYDFDDFKIFVQERFKITLKDSAAFTTGTNTDSTLTLACNKNYVSIAWSLKKEVVLDILKEIINSKNILPQNAAVFIKLKKEKSLVTAASSELLATLDINNKKILLHSSIDIFDKLDIRENTKKRTMDKASIASASFTLFPWASWFKNEYRIKQYRIETDSILKYFNGYADIEIGKSIFQTDTITSYEYDDNFEKKSKQTITGIKVPAIKLLLKAAPGMMNYLQKQQVVTTNHVLNKEVFPLYNVSVVQANEFLYFNTDMNNAVLPHTFENSNNFLDIQIDFKKDSTAFGIPYLQAYTKNISTISITGKKDKGAAIILDGVINLKTSVLKELMDMVKMF